MSFCFKRLPLAKTILVSGKGFILKMMNYYLSVKVIFPGSGEYLLDIYLSNSCSILLLITNQRRTSSIGWQSLPWEQLDLDKKRFQKPTKNGIVDSWPGIVVSPHLNTRIFQKRQQKIGYCIYSKPSIYSSPLTPICHHWDDVLRPSRIRTTRRVDRTLLRHQRLQKLGCNVGGNQRNYPNNSGGKRIPRWKMVRP